MIRVGVLRGGLGRSGYHLGTSQLPSRFALNSRSNCKIADLRVRDKGVCGLLGYDNINSLYNLKMEAVCFIETLITMYQTIWHNTEIHNLNLYYLVKLKYHTREGRQNAQVLGIYAVSWLV